MITDAQAAIQVQINVPEVKSGQIWKPVDFPGARRIRIVCRYPFTNPEEGRMWVTEQVNSLARMSRMPEITLRSLFTLVEDVR